MKKLTRPVQKVNAPVLGLDIHKNLIAYCLFDREGNEVEAGAVTFRLVLRWALAVH